MATPSCCATAATISEVIWSVSRGRLNTALIDAAEKAGARFVFDRRLTDATFGDDVALRFENESGEASEVRVPFAIGADGAGRALRAAMNATAPLGERSSRSATATRSQAVSAFICRRPTAQQRSLAHHWSEATSPPISR